jgi:hypothetical protein
MYRVKTNTAKPVEPKIESCWDLSLKWDRLSGKRRAYSLKGRYILYTNAPFISQSVRDAFYSFGMLSNDIACLSLVNS